MANGKQSGKDVGFFMKAAGKAAATMAKFRDAVKSSVGYIEELRKAMKAGELRMFAQRQIVGKMVRTLNTYTASQKKSTEATRESTKARETLFQKTKRVLRAGKDYTRQLKEQTRVMRANLAMNAMQVLQQAQSAVAASGAAEGFMGFSDSMRELNKYLGLNAEEYKKLKVEVNDLAKSMLDEGLIVTPSMISNSMRELAEAGIVGAANQKKWAQVAIRAEKSMQLTTADSADLVKRLGQTYGLGEKSIEGMFNAMYVGRKTWGVSASETKAAIDGIRDKFTLLSKNMDEATKKKSLAGFVNTFGAMKKLDLQNIDNINNLIAQAGFNSAEAMGPLASLGVNFRAVSSAAKKGDTSGALLEIAKGAANLGSNLTPAVLEKFAEATGIAADDILVLAKKFRAGELQKDVRAGQKSIEAATGSMKAMTDAALQQEQATGKLADQYKAKLQVALGAKFMDMLDSVGEGFMSIGTQMAPILLSLSAMAPALGSVGSAFGGVAASAGASMASVAAAVAVPLAPIIAIGAAIGALFLYSKYKKQIDAFIVKASNAISGFIDKAVKWIEALPSKIGLFFNNLPKMVEDALSGKKMESGLGKAFAKLGKSMLKLGWALWKLVFLDLPMMFFEKMLPAMGKALGMMMAKLWMMVADELWPAFKEWWNNAALKIGEVIKEALLNALTFWKDTKIGGIAGKAFSKIGDLFGGKDEKAGKALTGITTKTVENGKAFSKLKVEPTDEKAASSVDSMNAEVTGRMDQLMGLGMELVNNTKQGHIPGMPQKTANNQWGIASQ